MSFHRERTFERGPGEKEYYSEVTYFDQSRCSAGDSSEEIDYDDLEEPADNGPEREECECDNTEKSRRIEDDSYWWPHETDYGLGSRQDMSLFLEEDDEKRAWEDHKNQPIEFGPGELFLMARDDSAGFSSGSSFDDDAVPPSEEEFFSTDYSSQSDVGNYVPPLTNRKRALIIDLLEHRLRDSDDEDVKEAKLAFRVQRIQDFRLDNMRKQAARAYRRLNLIRKADLPNAGAEAAVLAKMEIADKRLYRPYYYEEIEPMTYKRLLQKRKNAIRRKYQRYEADPVFREKWEEEILRNVGKYIDDENLADVTKDDAGIERMFEDVLHSTAVGEWADQYLNLDRPEADATFEVAADKTFDLPANRTFNAVTERNITINYPDDRTFEKVHRTINASGGGNRTFNKSVEIDRTFEKSGNSNRTFEMSTNKTFDQSVGGNRTFDMSLEANRSFTRSGVANWTIDKSPRSKFDQSGKGNRTFDRSGGPNRTFDGPAVANRTFDKSVGSTFDRSVNANRTFNASSGVNRTFDVSGRGNVDMSVPVAANRTFVESSGGGNRTFDMSSGGNRTFDKSAKGNRTFDMSGTANRTIDVSSGGGNRTFDMSSGGNRTFHKSTTGNRTFDMPGGGNKTFDVSSGGGNRTFDVSSGGNRIFHKSATGNRTFDMSVAANRTFVESSGGGNRTFDMSSGGNRTFDKSAAANGTFDVSSGGGNRTFDRSTVGNRTFEQTPLKLNLNVEDEADYISVSDISSMYDDGILESELDFFSSDYEENCDGPHPGPNSNNLNRARKYMAKCRHNFYDTEEERRKKDIDAANIQAEWLNFVDKRRATKALTRIQTVHSQHLSYDDEAQCLLDLEMIDKKLHKPYYYARDEPETYKVLLGKRRRALIRKYAQYAASDEFRRKYVQDVFAGLLRVQQNTIFDEAESEYDPDSSFNDTDIPSSEEAFMSEGSIEVPPAYEKPLTRRKMDLYEQLNEYEPDTYDKPEVIYEKRKRRLDIIQRYRDYIANQRQAKTRRRLKEIREMGIEDPFIMATELVRLEFRDKKLNRSFYYSPGEPEAYQRLLEKRRNAILRKCQEYAEDREFREEMDRFVEHTKRASRIEPEYSREFTWQEFGSRPSIYDLSRFSTASAPAGDARKAKRRDVRMAGIYPHFNITAPAAIIDDADRTLDSSYGDLSMAKNYFKHLEGIRNQYI